MPTGEPTARERLMSFLAEQPYSLEWMAHSNGALAALEAAAEIVDSLPFGEQRHAIRALIEEIRNTE